MSFGDGHAFGVDPFDPNEILGHDSDARRYTSGTTPSFVQFPSHYSGGTYHADVEDIVAHPVNANEVWMAHHGGIARSTDNGATWTDRSKGLGVAQTWGTADGSSDDSTVAAGLFHDGTLLTEGAWQEQWSPRWKNISNGDAFRPMIAPTDSRFIWVSYQWGGSVWERSTDRGISFFWNGPDSPSWTFRGAVFDRLSPATQYRIGTSGEIVRTSNRGDDWLDTISNFGARFPSTFGGISRLYTPDTRSDVLLAIVHDGSQQKLFRTKKPRAAAQEVIGSWEELPMPAHLWISDIEFDPADPNILYIANAGGNAPAQSVFAANLIIRGDYTNPQQPVFTDLSQHLPNATTGNDALAMARDASGGLYLATDFGCYYSNAATRAAGNGWTPIGTRLPHTSFNGIKLDDRSRKVRVASYGRGMWEHDQVATIEGVAFHDLDRDGRRDPGEPPLSGREVTLQGTSVVTDANGRFVFAALAAGTYTLTQVVPDGWTETTSTRSVAVTAGAAVTNVDFGTDLDPRKTCAPAPAGMAAWWSFDGAPCATDRRREETAQFVDESFHLLTIAIDVVRPAAELVVRDRGRLVEMILVEEHAAQDAAEDAGWAMACRRGAVEKHFLDRTGTSFAPQHPAFGIDVAERHASRRFRIRGRMRNGAHVCAPHRQRGLGGGEPQRRAAIEADPHARDHVRGVANEPGVAIVVRRAGLAGHVAEAVALEARGRAAAHHAAQQGVHNVRGARARENFTRSTTTHVWMLPSFDGTSRS